MTLETRLAKLEAGKAQLAASPSGECIEQLWDQLVTTAVRVEHEYPDEAWCNAQSPASIAAKYLATKVGGTSTPALKKRAGELAKGPEPTAKLFQALEGIKWAA